MIKLDSNYAIEVDKYGYTLGIPKIKETIDKKTGETKEAVVMTDAKYYTSFEHALLGYRKIMRQKCLAKYDGSLDDALKVVIDLDEKLKKMLSRLEISE